MSAFQQAFKDPIVKKLGKVVAIGGFLTIGFGLYVESKIRSSFTKAQYFQRSLEIIHSNKNLITYLGPPIGIGKIDLGHKDTWITATKANLQVPVKGQNHSGNFYVWASRRSATSEWTVDRLEMSIDDQPGKRIIVHQAAANEGESTSTCQDLQESSS